MTHALPVILPDPGHNPSAARPSGQKAPLQPEEVWAIRIRLQLAGRTRDRHALPLKQLNLAQLGDDLFRLVSLSSHCLALLKTGQIHPKGRTTSMGAIHAAAFSDNISHAHGNAEINLLVVSCPGIVLREIS